MEYCIVHLSDFHFKSDKSFDEKKAISLGRTIRSESVSCDKTIIVISGDIAFSGHEEEYKIAESFFGLIKKELTNIEYDIICCPGNHDKNHDDNSNVCDVLIKDIVDNRHVKDGYTATLLKCFDDYTEFEEKICVKQSENSELSKTYKYKTENGQLIIKSLNTAWLSHKKLNPGDLYMPNEELSIKSNKDDITVLVQHNTLNWFLPEQQREIRGGVLRYTFVLTGHEHESSGYSIGSGQSISSIMVEGGELSPFTTNKNSSFNIVHVETSQKKYRLQTFRFDRNNGVYESQSDVNWELLPVKCHTALGKHKLTSKMESMLKDPGAPYTHHSVSSLKFENIFISPDLKVIERTAADQNNNTEQVFRLDKILSSESDSYALFIGEDRSGKTSVAKHIYINDLARGKVPVLIDGEKIKSHRPEAIQKAIKQSLNEQYKDITYANFVNFETNDKTLIIDDYHKLRLHRDDRAKLLKHFITEYNNIIIFADEYVRYDEYLSDSESDNILKERFDAYGILPFGHLLRNEVIVRWHSIGPRFDTDREDFLRKIDKAAYMLNTLVCSNFVPSYPFYLYTALSATSGDGVSNIAESTYAAYYTSLLFNALKKINKDPSEIDLNMSYLSELAYKIHTAKKSNLSTEDFNSFHAEYCDKYQILRDPDTFKGDLTRSMILEAREGGLFFKYKYFFYYYLAKYLSDNITKTHAQDVVINCCTTLHMDTSANVIMFLTHLTKNPDVIDSIIQQAESLFNSDTVIHLENDIEIVNKLIKELPTIQFTPRDPMEHRKDVLQHYDNINPPSNNTEQSNGKTIDFTSHDDKCVSKGSADELLLSIGATYKTLDIIGLILKTHFGSLDGKTKHSLCSEGYALPLRALSNYFKSIADCGDTLTEQIEILLHLKSDKALTKTDKDNIARQFIFRLSEQLSFSFIKKAATALGSSKLKMTYSSILKENNYTSVKLIDLAIKMDCSDTFPLVELKEIAKELKRNVVAFSVLRRLAIHKMYMFNIDRAIRQQICSILEISPSAQLQQKLYASEKGIAVQRST